MNIDDQLFYICLIAFVTFIVWRVKNNPLTQIHQAVIDGDIDLVRQCLENSVNADFSRGGGFSLLYLATGYNHIEVAELLISYGADVNQGLNEEYGMNPLLEATICNHSKLAKMLMSNGARSGLHLAALQGDVYIVRSFLEQQIFSINSIRNSGLTPLHLAVMGGHRQVIELLLNSGATIDFFTTAGETPLYQAIKFNRLELTNLLIDRGADPNHILALHLAVRQNYPDLVRLLITKSVDVNYQRTSVNTPLHTAAEQGFREIAEILLANGAQVNIKSKVEGKTPLHYASQKDFLNVVELLVNNNAKINMTDNFLRTPLDYAVHYNNFDTVDFLKQNGGVECVSLN
jgi:ankyrin repeat protein